MNIFPKFYRIFRVIENTGRQKAILCFYNEKGLIYLGEIDNFSPKQFDELKYVLDCLIKINNSNNTPLVFGIQEIQNLVKERFK